MPVIDLAFELRGTTIPLDYGYGLFSAISRVVPQIHGDRRLGIHPIRGIRYQARRLTLVPQSRLRLRLPSEEIATYLSLAGSRIEVDGDSLSVGIPRVEPLRPAVSLTARLVTIGRLSEAATFEESARRQMAGLGVSAVPTLIPSTDPDREGQPTRRVLSIKGRRIVGYAVRVDGLTAEESIIVQEMGLGSRRRMGCGVFVRAREEML